MPPQETPAVALPPLPHARGAARLALLAGTLARLGAPALLRYARHRWQGGQALPEDAPVPRPPFLHDAAAAEVTGWFGPVPEAMRTLPALAVPTNAAFDIRRVWEQARLADLPALPPDRAEALVRSFVAANPPFRGPHWACGQEAAIRLAHLLAAAGAEPLRPGMRALVALHRDRIQATLGYAMAQDNNHATSEAAGLWIAGMVLDEAETAARGRALLERAVLRLFLPGGAFAQQSMRYQALALAMPAFAQRMAAARGRPGLSAAALARLRQGAGWLGRIAGPRGAAWRVGHDDGSRLFATDEAGILDLAEAAFGPRPDAGGPAWLDAEGGFAGLAEGRLRAFLRLPVQKFRPAQADALHLELWLGETCLLGDAGTALYNFNADPAAPDLARTAAHNTIAFDDDDQMPRLGRFLYAAWLRPGELAAAPGRMLGAYRDWKGRCHRREVRLSAAGLAVEDRFDGRFAQATARFRLPEAPWRIEGASLLGGPLAIAVAGAARLRLVRLPFAPAYGRWTTTPALEAIADRPGRLGFAITVAEARGKA